MQGQAGFIGDLENTQHFQGRFPENFFIGNGDALAFQREAFRIALKEFRGQAENGPSLLCGLKRSQEDAGQIPHILGDQKVMLHEAFNATAPGAVVIQHPIGQFRLNVKGHAFLRPVRQVMQMASHGPQEELRLSKACDLSFGQGAFFDHLGNIFDAIQKFRTPIQGMQVSQSALAILYIGFQHIATVAHAFVPLIPLCQFGFQEIHLPACDNGFAKACPQLGKQGLIAPDIACFQQGGADCPIRLCLAQALIDRPGGMPDLKADIP